MGLLAGLAVATCQFPTDKSDEVYVVLTPSDTLLARGIIGQGQTAEIFAQTWRRLPNGDSAEVLNVDYIWSSDNTSLAQVERKSGGFAEVTGVNVGTVAIRARAAAFDRAIDAAVPVRVAQSFVIDSVRPTSMGYGGKVSVYGVRIQQIFFMDLGFGSLIPDEFSFSGSLEGLGRMDYWVPYPTTSGHPFFFGPGVFGAVADSVDVQPRDIYEPNWEFPTVINIDGPGGPRTLAGDPVLFYNPALYYEPFPDPAGDGPFALDWYRFVRSDTTSAITYIISSQVFDDTAFVYVADSFYFNGGNYTAEAWLHVPDLGFYQCDGQFFGQNRGTRTPTTFVALKSQPGHSVHLVSNYGKDGPYSVAVVDGYQVQDRRIGPDRFEENDNWCRWGKQNFDNSTDSTSPNRMHIVVGLPGFGQNGPWLDSTLTIDNAHDIDWYKFRVQPPVLGIDTMTYIRTKSRPLAGVDFSDIDIYVYDTAWAFRGSSTRVGSVDSLRLKLLAGDYYLGVVDAASTPTRYSLCVIKTSTGSCLPPGLSPPAPLAPSVYRIPTLAPVAQRLQRLQRLGVTLAAPPPPR